VAGAPRLRVDLNFISRRLVASTFQYPITAIAESLPLELWLIIFEMAFDPMNDPPGGCSHRIFPEVDFRLRSPWTCIPMDQLRQNLRLVSRTFNNMIISSPDSILIKSSNSVIPPRTRSVCISNYGDALAGLRQLLAQPGGSSRISTLVMPLQLSYKYSSLLAFDLLCHNGSSLPSIRRLTLVYPASAGKIIMKNLWSRINDAFPLLTCLVLGPGMHCSDEATDTIFKKLEILNVYCLRPSFRLRFPLLRHAAITSLTNVELEALERSIHLESMLVHRIHGISRRIDGRAFEQLRLLGVPLLGMHWIAPFPPNHPLELLCLSGSPKVAGFRRLSTHGAEDGCLFTHRHSNSRGYRKSLKMAAAVARKGITRHEARVYGLTYEAIERA
jgi:hypothetical protein